MRVGGRGAELSTEDGPTGQWPLAILRLLGNEQPIVLFLGLMHIDFLRPQRLHLRVSPVFAPENS